MIVISTTLKTFDHKVSKIKSLAKKKYYLQKILKKTNKRIDLILWSLKYNRNKYIEMLSKYPTAKDPVTLDYIKFSLSVVLPEEKSFKSHVLTLLKELEH